MTPVTTARPDPGPFVNFRPETSHRERDLAARITTYSRDVAALIRPGVTPAVYAHAVRALAGLEIAVAALKEELDVRGQSATD